MSITDKLYGYYATAKNTTYDLVTSAANKIKQEDIPAKADQVYKSVSAQCRAIWTWAKGEPPPTSPSDCEWQIIHPPSESKKNQ